MLATFTGVVESGVDDYETFNVGKSLAGQSFVAHYLYETDLGTQVVTPTEDKRFGGPGFGGGVSPILAADFILNGHAEQFSLGQDGASNVFLNPKDGWLQTFFYTNYFFDDGNGNSQADFLRLFVLDAPMLIRLTTPYTGFNHDFPGPPETTNELGYSSYTLGAPPKSFHADLVTTSVNLRPVAVPEPGVWGLMITGFFGLGLALRRRRATGSAAANTAA